MKNKIFAHRVGVGVDIAKDNFVVAISITMQDFNVQNIATRSFSNTTAGFKLALNWFNKNLAKLAVQTSITWVMEATGTYHENLLYFLFDHKQKVAVVNPKQIKKYLEGLTVKSKTDNLDAKGIAQFALERKPKLWEKPSILILTLKALYRERAQWVNEKVRLDNRIHAKQYAQFSSKSSLKRLKDELSRLEKYISAIEQEAKDLVKSDADFAKKFARLQQVKGVAFITAWGVVAETGGFTCSPNAKTLVAYTGLDIVLKDSGKYKGKMKVSRKGNGTLRGALFMAALSAERYDGKHKDFACKIRSRRQYHRTGTVALARKLLVLLKALWEGDHDYDPNYGSTSTVVISEAVETIVEEVEPSIEVLETNITAINASCEQILVLKQEVLFDITPVQTKKKVGKLVTPLHEIAAVP